METDRRNKPRIKTEIKVDIFSDNEIVLTGTGKILDMGINSAGIETLLDMDEGKQFSMRFLLEEKYLVNVRAEVVRKVKKDPRKLYGVVFNKIDMMDKKNIGDFIKADLSKGDSDTKDSADRYAVGKDKTVTQKKENKVSIFKKMLDNLNK